MLKLSTDELKQLIKRVCKKYGWTQEKLSQELNVADATVVSRWGRTGKIHKVHYTELQRLDREDPPARGPAAKGGIPFTASISPRDLKIVTDENGNIVVRGILRLI